MNERFESLSSGEVVSVQNDIQVLNGHRTFRVGELSEAIEHHLKQAIPEWNEDKNGWFNQQGIECEALRFGSQGWQKGRIRFCLEFCPDESDAENQPHSTSISSTTSPASPLASPTIQESSSTVQAETPTDRPEFHATVAAAPSSETIDSHTAPLEEDADRQNAEPAAIERTPVLESNRTPLETTAIPAFGIAASTVAVTTATAIATDAAPAIMDDRTANDRSNAPIADAVLESEPDHIDFFTQRNEELEEIAFDFDNPLDSRGFERTNSIMELDLTDLNLDLPEDPLDVEANGVFDDPYEFINLQDLDERPERSGMLIDEVWNEMSKPNWPRIN